MTNTLFDESERKRLATSIRSAGFSFTYDEPNDTYRIDQVGYQNRSVDARVSLEEYLDVRLIKFEATVVAEKSSFESCLVGVFFGNSKSKISSFHPREIVEGQSTGYQIVARSFLYADYYSDAELKALLQIFIKEVDEIDDELIAIVEKAK